MKHAARRVDRTAKENPSPYHLPSGERIKVGAFAGMRKNVSWGIGVVLFSLFIGCASAPQPVIIQHERIPSQSDAALSAEQARKEPADPRIAATLADLQRRKDLSDQKNAALLELLKSKKVISDEDASLITGQTQTATEPAEEQVSTAVLESQKSLEDIKEEIRSEVTNELLREVWKINRALTEKDKRLRFNGDLRLRYEKDRFDKNNADFAQPASPSVLMNTKVDSDRFKYRVRFGAEAMVNEQWDAVIRLASGSTTNPVSTNATMGDYMNKDTVLFDSAYLRWRPEKWVTVYGGRMPNPWFSSDLVWDSDLNFEGLAMQVRTPIAESWTPFITAGAFPLQQYDFTQHGKWLMAGQLGLDRKSQNGVGFKIGAAYYNFKNITGVPNDPDNPGATDWTAPQFQQKGNTLFNISADPNVYKTALASEFKELNVTGTLDIGFWDPFHIVFLGDYVKNLGFKKSDVAQRTGNTDPARQIEGYQYGMSLGYPAAYASGQWRVYFYKKRLGADAVVDGFTDSDFHLGGTNAKGWILGTDVGLAKNTWLTLRWMTADEISGPPLAIDVLQVDLNARF